MTGTRNRVSNYYNVNLGKISKDLGKTEPEDMTGVTKRINKNGEAVYEIVSDYIAGKIVAAEMKAPPEGKEDFGSQMALTLEAESGTKAVVNCKFDSAYGRGFMFAIPNADLTKVIELEPYQYFSKKKGKDVSGLSVFQNGKQLDWAYGTRDKTGGMPELVEVVFKGKKTWDNTDQLAFLEKKFAEFTAQIAALNTGEVVAEEVAAEGEAEAKPTGRKGRASDAVDGDPF